MEPTPLRTARPPLGKTHLQTLADGQAETRIPCNKVIGKETMPAEGGENLKQTKAGLTTVWHATDAGTPTTLSEIAHSSQDRYLYAPIATKEGTQRTRVGSSTPDNRGTPCYRLTGRRGHIRDQGQLRRGKATSTTTHNPTEPIGAHRGTDSTGRKPPKADALIRINTLQETIL